MKTTKLLAILFISALSFTACSDDDHDDDHDHEHEEEITQLVYTLTNTNNATDIITLTFTDEDGEGGADGTTDVSGYLTAGATYTGELELINLEENEDVSAEIAEDDAEDHEVFYITDISGLTFAVTDLDADSNNLGFNTDVTTDTAGTGSLTISVVHEGKKPNTGIDDALSGEGTTDIEVTFDIEVKSVAVLLEVTK